MVPPDFRLTTRSSSIYRCMINKKQTQESNMVSSVTTLMWASAILASASVMVLYVTAQVSATAVIQAVIVLTIVWSLYRDVTSLITPMKDMKRQRTSVLQWTPT
jgi:hypothetical protein